MDHESTLANAGASVVGQTFDNEGSSGSAVFKASLSGGTSDNAPTNGELELAYDKFADAESVDINFIIGGPSQTGADATGDTKATMLIDLAEARKDCVAFISPARADVVNVTDPVTQTENVAAFADGLPSSSYAVFDSGYKYQFDKYNDVYRFVPLNGDVAGLCARTDLLRSWYSKVVSTEVNQRRIKISIQCSGTERYSLQKKIIP